MKKNKIILIGAIIGLVIVLVILIGTSYAYLRKVGIQNNSNAVSTLSCLDIALDETSNAILMEKAFPISTTLGMTTTPFTFTITNNCNTRVFANINMESLPIESPGVRMGAAYIRYSLNGGTSALLSSKSTTTATISGAESRTLVTRYIEANQVLNYNIRIWIDQDATAAQVQGKEFAGKIVIVANATPFQCEQKDSVFSEAGSGTLLAALNDSKYCYLTKPITIAGRAISASTESAMYATADDYGTSYYFRGTQSANYVLFANKCWRIMRVTGDDGTSGDFNSAIKLILYNDNAGKIANPCNQTGNILSFAKYDTTTNGKNGKGAFNASKESNTYVGYVYGTPNGSTYLEEHTPVEGHDSTMLTNIKKWADRFNLNYYRDYMADVIWCNDKRLYSGTGIGTDNTTFAGSRRVKPKSGAAPSLKCGDSKTDNVISKFTAADTEYGNGMLYTRQSDNSKNYYKIGLMTSDEGAFAGLAYDTNHSSPYGYLYQNTNSWWWTLTPTIRTSSVLNINEIGQSLRIIDDANLTSTGGGIRPMIALKSTVKVTGSGTTTDPYVVQEEYPNRNLPSEYQQVRYLQNVSGNYIDTGLSLPNGFHAIIDMETISTTAGFIMGSEDDDPYNRNYIKQAASWELGAYGYANAGTNNIGKHLLEVSTIHDNIKVIDNGKLTYSTNSENAARSSRNIFVFKNNTALTIAASNTMTPFRLFGLKIYSTADTSTLERDFVPCYRKSDSAAGLYDLVHNVFYPNNGTGSFTVGADVN